MAWQSSLFKATRKVAANPAVIKAGKKGAEKLGAAVVVGAGGAGASLLKNRGTRRKNKKLAIKLAQQVGGQYSTGIVVDGEERCVVWKHRKPIDVFPRLDEKMKPEDLAKRPELQNLPSELFRDPPPIKESSSLSHR